MNIEACYFHTIRPYKFKKNNYKNYSENFVNESCSILEKILDSGYIMCRESLKNIWDINTLDNERTNWNGIDCVSTSMHPLKMNQWYLTEGYEFFKEEFAFRRWHNGYLTLILSSEIEKVLSINIPENHQPDEVQFIGDIPTKYICGVLMHKCETHFIHSVKEILIKYNLKIPIIDIDFEQIIAEYQSQKILKKNIANKH